MAGMLFALFFYLDFWWSGVYYNKFFVFYDHSYCMWAVGLDIPVHLLLAGVPGVILVLTAGVLS